MSHILTVQEVFHLKIFYIQLAISTDIDIAGIYLNRFNKLRIFRPMDLLLFTNLLTFCKDYVEHEIPKNNLINWIYDQR